MLSPYFHVLKPSGAPRQWGGSGPVPKAGASIADPKSPEWRDATRVTRDAARTSN